MLKFKYSYQRVLDLKTREKEAAQAQVAQAMRKLEKAEQTARELSAQLEREENKLWAVGQSISISEIRNRVTYIEHLRRQMMQQQLAVRMASRQVQQKQNILDEKVKEEKKWSIHKEKLALQYLEERKRQEQLQLDELSAQRYFRQQLARSEDIGRE